jgi:hypothetical protein
VKENAGDVFLSRLTIAPFAQTADETTLKSSVTVADLWAHNRTPAVLNTKQQCLW